MTWRCAGEYFMGCTCSRDIHWPIDGSLSDANGACRSVSVFRLGSGEFGRYDLSGLKFAVFNFFPPKISSGDWQMGVVVDDHASDGQVACVESIMRGQEGGPMSSLAELIGDYIGTDRASIGLLEGLGKMAAIEGRGHFAFFPTLQDGRPVPAPSAMWTFAEHYEIGRSDGTLSGFGVTWSAEYGEYGQFSFNSEMTGMEREFRPGRLGGIYGHANPFGTPKND